jgi:hypothetical protein
VIITRHHHCDLSASYAELLRSHLRLISVMIDYDREAARYDVTRGRRAGERGRRRDREPAASAAVRIADLGLGT